jgi:hypothetical protein
VNFFPRYAATFLQLPPHEIKLCEASALCMGLAAWAFSVHGLAVEPVICCFDCVDDLVHRARAAEFPTKVDRVQPDLCQACGRRVDDARHVIDRIPVGATLSHFASRVGPFCGPPCAMRWTNARRREGLS